MVSQEVLRKVANHLPPNVRSLAKKVLYKDRHWAHPALKGFGTVQDLYYWVADDNLDTLLLLQNYFSVLYPTFRTETEGAVALYSKDGVWLGKRAFSLAHCGGAKLKVSSILEELQISPDNTFGTLEVNIAIPRHVLEHIQGQQKSFYFWDRFYISYMNSKGQLCFVHGVDKTHIYREGESEPVKWYKTPEGRQWAPEIPVDIEDYQKFIVILINRTSRKTPMALFLSDDKDNSLFWSAEIPPNGVHRFELTKENTAGLATPELRMRVKGMASQFGRPVVFKEFHNGAISAMHC